MMMEREAVSRRRSGWSDERHRVVMTYVTFSCHLHLHCCPASPRCPLASQNIEGRYLTGSHGPGRHAECCVIYKYYTIYCSKHLYKKIPLYFEAYVFFGLILIYETLKS